MAENKISTSVAIVVVVIVAVVASVGTYFLAGGGPTGADVEELQAKIDELESELKLYENLSDQDIAYKANETPYEILIEREAKEYQWTDTVRFKTDPPWTIGISTIVMGIPWCQQWIAVAEKVADSTPWIEKIVHVNAEGDVSKQVSDVQNLVTMAKQGEIDGIIVDAGSVSAFNRTFEDAWNDGIPIIVAKNAVDMDYQYLVSNIIGHNWTYGYKGMKWLCEYLGGEGEIIMVKGIKGYPKSDSRDIGAYAALEEYPNVKVVAEDYGEWTYSTSKDVFRDMYAANPEFDGLWASGGQGNLGAMDMMDEMGVDYSDIPMSGELYNGFLEKVVEKGMPAVACGDRCDGSGIAMHLMMKTLTGWPVPKLMFWPCQAASTDGYYEANLADYYNPDLPEGAFFPCILSDEEIIEAIGEMR